MSLSFTPTVRLELLLSPPPLPTPPPPTPPVASLPLCYTVTSPTALRGYLLNVSADLTHYVNARLDQYPRLAKAVRLRKNLLLSPQAEKGFLSLDLPYTCLGTADDRGEWEKWSDLMSSSPYTFEKLE